MSIRHNSRRIAIVDDDESIQRALQDLTESDGLSALCFGSAEQFLNSEARRKAACLIADIRMPGMSGLELQAKLTAEGCRIPIIFMTAHGDAEMRTPRREPNFSYGLLRAIYPAFRLLVPNQVIRADDLARVMVDVAVRITGERGGLVFENRDIRAMVESLQPLRQ
jgi:CheY-like chemotaxis protein